MVSAEQRLPPAEFEAQIDDLRRLASSAWVVEQDVLAEQMANYVRLFFAAVEAGEAPVVESHVPEAPRPFKRRYTRRTHSLHQDAAKETVAKPRKTRKRAQEELELEPVNDDLLAEILQSDYQWLRQHFDLPLLAAEEELALGERIQNGIAAQEILDEMKEEGDEVEGLESLQTAVVDGNIAREQLVAHNYRLVFSLAKKTFTNNLSIGEKFNLGCMGLMKAVAKFDPKRKHRFSTYATWWIRQAITRGKADEDSTIRTPVHIEELVNKYWREKNKWQKYADDNATEAEFDQEFAAKYKLSEKKMKLLKETLERRGVQKSLNFVISGRGGNEETEFGELLVDESFVPPEIQTAEDELHSILVEILFKLNDKDRRVIAFRFGLWAALDYQDRQKAQQIMAQADEDRENFLTLEEVGSIFGVTRERVRQIEGKAMQKFRYLVVQAGYRRINDLWVHDVVDTNEHWRKHVKR